MNAIYTRRSIRNYSDKQVEQEKIEQILKAAMQAPSARNQQAWQFIVVKGKNNLEALSNFSPHAKMTKDASCAIVVLGDKNRMKSPDRWEQDLGAATQNLMLEAADLGLGTVWLGTAPTEDYMDNITKLYDLDESLVPYCVVSVGYPADSDANTFVDRFDASRIRYIG